MKIARRIPSLNFTAFDDALTQLKLYRMICGGIYVKMQNRWYGASVLLVMHDQSRVFIRDDQGGGSFHETFSGIEALEERP